MKPGLPRRLLGWMVPSGSCAAVGTFSGNARAAAGMLKAIQCSASAEPLFGATSGSCMISAKLAVPAGTLSQLRAGDTGVVVLAWVYLSGMTPPSVNAELVSVMGVTGGGAAGACADANSAAPVS